LKWLNPVNHNKICVILFKGLMDWQDYFYPWSRWF